MKKIITKEYCILFSILIIGLALRLPGVITNSFAYTYDVGRDMLAVHNIVNNHKVPLIGPTTGFQGIFYGPWWYYILSIPFILSGGNPQVISFFIGILSLIAAVFGYLGGRRIGGQFSGYVLASFICFSPILTTVQIWNPYLVYPLIALLLFSLSYIFDKNTTPHKSLLAYLVTGVSLGLIIDSEIFFGVLFMAGVGISCAISLRHELSFKKIGALACGLLVILSPRILFDIRHQFLMTKSFLKVITHGIPQTHHTPFIQRELYIWDVFFSLWTYTVANKIMALGVVLLLLTIFSFIKYLKKENILIKRFFYVCLSILGVFIGYFSTNSTDIYDHFLVGIPIIFVLLISLSLSLLYTNYKKYVAIFIALIVFILLISPIHFMKTMRKPLWEGDSSVYRNTLLVVDYIYKDAQKKPFSTMLFTPTNQDDTYKYLFLWYGQKKYHYQPHADQKVRYVILEPDTQYDGYRTKLWLEEHKNDGEVISEKKLPGGIIVQKRIGN